MSTLSASCRHSSRLPIVEVKPIKDIASTANRLLIVSPAIKPGAVRAPCTELNTNSGPRTGDRSPIRIYQTRDDNSQDTQINTRADEQIKMKTLPRSAKLLEGNSTQTLSRIPRPRHLKTTIISLDTSYDRGVTSPRDAKSTNSSTATTPRNRKTGAPLGELDRKWALQQCEDLTTWTRDTLKMRNMKLSTDLRKAVSDGVTLPTLVDITYGTDLTSQLNLITQSESEDNLTEDEIIENLSRCLKEIKLRAADDISDIKPLDLRIGDLKSILITLTILKSEMGQEKSKLAQSKSTKGDQQKLLTRGDSKARETTPKINNAINIQAEENNNKPHKRKSASQEINDSSIQKIKVKPELPPRGVNQGNYQHKPQALLTTFQQPLASYDTPRHSLHSKQRRFGGLKQASSLDCLDERIPQDDLVTQSLNINNPAAFNDGDLLTRSLDSFQGRRSLSSVSINVDSGEKEYDFDTDLPALTVSPTLPEPSFTNGSASNEHILTVDVTPSAPTQDQTNMYSASKYTINHSNQGSAFHKPSAVGLEGDVPHNMHKSKHHPSHGAALLVRGQPSGASNPTTPATQPDYERIRNGHQLPTSTKQNSQQKTATNYSEHHKNPPPAYQPRAGSSSSRKSRYKSQSRHTKPDSGLNSHDNGSYHKDNYEYYRAEPLYPPQDSRGQPSPLYGKSQEAALNKTQTVDHIKDVGNNFSLVPVKDVGGLVENYSRSPKVAKKPGTNHHNSPTVTESTFNGHSKALNQSKTETDHRNYLPGSPVGFSIISPASSETQTLSAGSDNSPGEQDGHVLASDLKYENITEAQLKRLSMPTGYHYSQSNGHKPSKQAARRDKYSDEVDLELDNHEHYDIPAVLGGGLENAGMETSIYDNNRPTTPSLPVLTDNTDIESVSDVIHNGVRYQRSASVCDKMMFTKEGNNLQDGEEYVLDDLDQELTEDTETGQYGPSSKSKLKKKQTTRSSGRKQRRSPHSTQPAVKSVSQHRDLEEKIHKLENLFEDLSMYLGVDGVVQSGDNKRGSVTESVTSSQWSYNHHKAGRRYKNGRSAESKANQKRFQRIESHIITLARSVAHISSEMRSHTSLFVEVDKLARDVEAVKQVLEKNGNTVERTADLTNLAVTSDKANGTLSSSTIDSKDRTQKLNKLTKFFGQEPPMMKAFLKELGYEKYLSQFEAERIGMIELPYMTEDKLGTIGIPLGPRTRILQEAKTLQTQLPVMNGIYKPITGGDKSTNGKKSKR